MNSPLWSNFLPWWTSKSCLKFQTKKLILVLLQSYAFWNHTLDFSLSLPKSYFGILIRYSFEIVIFSYQTSNIFSWQYCTLIQTCKDVYGLYCIFAMYYPHFLMFFWISELEDFLYVFEKDSLGVHISIISSTF